MDSTMIDSVRRLVPNLLALPSRIESSYDEEADVLYVTLEPGTPADDSELTDDDIILRYVGDRLVGVTVLHASKRASA